MKSGRGQNQRSAMQSSDSSKTLNHLKGWKLSTYLMLCISPALYSPPVNNMQQNIIKAPANMYMRDINHENVEQMT